MKTSLMILRPNLPSHIALPKPRGLGFSLPLAEARRWAGLLLYVVVVVGFWGCTSSNGTLAVGYFPKPRLFSADVTVDDSGPLEDVLQEMAGAPDLLAHRANPFMSRLVPTFATVEATPGEIQTVTGTTPNGGVDPIKPVAHTTHTGIPLPTPNAGMVPAVDRFPQVIFQPSAVPAVPVHTVAEVRLAGVVYHPTKAMAMLTMGDGSQQFVSVGQVLSVGGHRVRVKSITAQQTVLVDESAKGKAYTLQLSEMLGFQGAGTPSGDP